MNASNPFRSTPLALAAGTFSLLAASLYAAHAQAQSQGPATITVSASASNALVGVVDAVDGDGLCSLIGAIINANFGDSRGDSDCVRGSDHPSDTDTIVLPTGATFTLTSVNNEGFGPNGLPFIRSPISIQGNGSTIVRSSTAPRFRFFQIGNFSVAGNLTLDRLTLTGGSNTGSGGAISVLANADRLTLTRSTISGNTADGDGGGIGSGGVLSVTDSTISGNAAGESGGAIGLNGGPSTTLSNVTLTGNTASRLGGAFNAAGNATLNNVTITGNLLTSQFSRGAGIQIDSRRVVTLSNSVIAGNTVVDASGQGAEVFVVAAQSTEPAGTLNTPAPNLFGHAGLSSGAAFGNVTLGAGQINATSDGSNVPLTSILNTTLASNGGPTQTHALVSGSPAVNASGTGATTTDQRGFVKAQGDTVRDIGAYELNGVDPNAPVVAVNGACGEANGSATSMAPASGDLCATGTASAVTGINGAWGWMCEGSNGGETANCSAPYANQTITLAADPTDILVGETSAVVASSTSGLLPVVTSTTTDVCSIQPRAGQPLTSTVIATGVRAGTCTVLANHPGTGDNGTARFLAATQQSKDITVTAAPVAGGSACDAFTKGENVNVIDLRMSPGGVTTRGVSGKFNVIYGSGFNDSLTGGNAGNCIDGGAGNDRLTAGAGANSLYGGEGNDTLTPGTGSTAMDGGDGTDRCGRTSGRATATRTSCELN